MSDLKQMGLELKNKGLAVAKLCMALLSGEKINENIGYLGRLPMSGFSARVLINRKALKCCCIVLVT